MVERGGQAALMAATELRASVPISLPDDHARAAWRLTESHRLVAAAPALV